MKVIFNYFFLKMTINDEKKAMLVFSYHLFVSIYLIDNEIKLISFHYLSFQIQQN